MSKITLNGLENKQFKQESKAIKECCKSLSYISKSKKGHLADVVSGIRTNISILELQAKILWAEFEKQKEAK